MRSREEILFRLSQEFHNARMLVFAPRAPAIVHPPLPGLADAGPVVARLSGSQWSHRVEEIADKLLERRFPLLGSEIQTGTEIAWRRDYSSSIETSPQYFRFIPYLDAARAGDHKVLWELNRHQHLVLLTQAGLLTGREEFHTDVHRQLESWLHQNPFLRGINWTSALEVAFRALSWVWVYHWAGNRMPDDLRRRFLHSLYQHGLYLEHNLSVYFSPNTHLLGEAVALHLLGRVFPTWPHSRSWEQRAGDVVAQELRRQVREDGGHFEQSTYYHVYALDFFLLHKLVARSVPEEYDAALIRMAELLRAVMGHNWVLPFFGDDDGGRLFHPYGERDRFGRGTLAAAAVILGVPKWLRDPEDLNDIALWWLGAGSAQAEKGPPVSPVSQLFAATGLGVLRSDDISVVVDAGPFGPGSGGHSHADTLNIVVTAGSVEVLVDAGTYTYVGDARARDWFRSTPAHNTIRVSGVDQAAPAGPFRWASRPDVSLEAWQTTPEYDYLDASCCYRGIIHRRALVFVKSPAVLFVVDFIRGPEGEQMVEQFWHTGAGTVAAGPSRFRIGDSAELILSEGTRTALSIGGENGWRSRALGHREEAPVIVAVYNGRLPAVMASAISFSKALNLPLRTEQSAGRVLLDFGVSIEIGEPGHVNIDASRQWEYRDSPTLR